MSELLLALVLGFKHGLDADHLSLIDNLGRWLRERAPRTARFAGLLFSTGHSLAVMTMTVIAAQFGHQFKAAIPEWLEGTGTMLAALSLIVLAGINLRSVWASPHSPHLSGVRLAFARHLSSRTAAWTVMGLGALFAFSFDTLTQAALFASLGHHQPQPLLHAFALSALFGLGMVLSDSFNGLFVNKLLDRLSRGQSDGVNALASRHQAMRYMTLSLACLSLVVAAIAITKLLALPAVRGLEGQELQMGLGVIGWVVLSYFGAAWVSTRRPKRVL